MMTMFSERSRTELLRMRPLQRTAGERFSRRRSVSAQPRLRGFTLIELMAVLVIMVIIMGVTMPAFNKLVIGTGVEAAARMVGGQLRLARQYAITQRANVALLVPRGGQISSPGNVSYVAIRPCVVTRGSSPTFTRWIPNTKWEFLPAGSVIAEADNDLGMQSPPNDGVSGTNHTIATLGVSSGAVASGTTNVRAIVFRPTGRIQAATQRIVTVAEGMYVGTGLQIRNTSNTYDIHVDQFTGRVTYQ